MKFVQKLENSEATIHFGERLGKLLQAGDILLLSGDLGAGKTTFTKGLAQGLGITEVIKSPTYTLVREYESGALPLYHMDVYRIQGEVSDIGIEEYFDRAGICVIEWGELLDKELFSSYVHIHLKRTIDQDQVRILEISGESLRSQELMTELKQKGET